MNVVPIKFDMAKLKEERDFFNKLNLQQKSELRIALLGKYATSSYEEDYADRYGDFAHLTEMIWDDLVWLSKEEFVELAIKKQIAEALFLNFDVFLKIIWFFYYKCVRIDDYRALFIQTKDALLQSGAIIGYWEEKKYTISDVVKEMKLIRSKGRDSIEMAQFIEKIRKIINLDNDEFAAEFFMAEASDFYSGLFDLLEFFLETEPEEMAIKVLNYTRPDIENAEEYIADISAFEKNLPPMEPPEIPNSILILSEDLRKNNIDNTPVKSAPVSKISSAPAVLSRQELVKPSYSEIYQKIDAVFEKDEEGNYDDLDSVMMALEKAAKKYNDPKIAELYYFDEQTGKFKWNI